MASGPEKRRAESGSRRGFRQAGRADHPQPAGREQETPDRIREAVLSALERRRRTRSQLETILKRKGFVSGDFTPVLDRLTEVGLIDDLQYARVYLGRRAVSRPRGDRLLRVELLAKGISGEIADQALDEMKGSTDPVDGALRALKLWLPRNAGLDLRDKRRKLWQFLARRGFSPDVIERAALIALDRESVGAGDDGDPD